MPTVRASHIPMYLQGWMLDDPTLAPVFPAHLVRSPRVPLYLQGWSGLHLGQPSTATAVSKINPGNTIGPWSLIGPAVVSKSGGAVSSALESAAAGASQGAMFGPIGAGIGALAGAIAGLWASHAVRAKGATTENAALNSALQAFDASLKAVFQAANSGAVTGAQAAQTCSQILQSYWAGMAPFQTGPGRADASHGGMMCASPGTLNLTTDNCARFDGSLPCNKGCTAGCCVGCNDLAPAIMAAIAVFSSPTGGPVNVCTVKGSGYGAQTRSGYTLTYTPPTAAQSASGLLSDLTGSGSGGTSGIPGWMILAGGAAALFALA